MNEQTNKQGLSTADMAAATDRPNGNTSSVATMKERRDGEPVDWHAAGSDSAPLLNSDESAGFRSRWDSIQTSFVDEPRKAVEQADGLVAESIKRLAEVFAKERSGLEQQWSRGNEVNTDDLRQAMLRYRSFFQRLLSV